VEALSSGAVVLKLIQETNMITKKALRTTIAIACIASLSACSGMTQREKDTAVGAAIGGAAGAAITGSALGTAAGVAAGGVIGHEVSRDRGR
jgi:osmotically inducible lipoprotein OsmB